MTKSAHDIISKVVDDAQERIVREVQENITFGDLVYCTSDLDDGGLEFNVSDGFIHVPELIEELKDNGFKVEVVDKLVYKGGLYYDLKHKSQWRFKIRARRIKND